MIFVFVVFLLAVIIYFAEFYKCDTNEFTETMEAPKTTTTKDVDGIVIDLLKP